MTYAGKAQSAASLGQQLVKQGWISPEKLSQALTRQQELGGQIGTCLLEVEAITEDLLGAALSRQLGVPAVQAQELRDASPELYSALSPKLAVRHGAIPFRRRGQQIDIALRDVGDLAALDELAFVLGHKLNPHLSNEARIAEALQRYYGRECPVRLANLLERLDGGRSAAPPARPPETAAPSAPPERRVAAAGRSAARAAPPPPGGPAPTPLESPAEAPAGTPGRTPAEEPAAAELTLEEVEERLEASRTPDEVGTALLDFLAQEFVRVLLLRVRRERLEGWMGRGPGVQSPQLRAYSTGFDEPSIFLNLKQGGSFFLGTLPDLRSHRRLAQCWGEGLEHECAVIPIRIRDRLVSLVYGDRDCLGLSGLDIALVRRLAAKAAIAFEMCIMQQKLRKV